VPLSVLESIAVELFSRLQLLVDNGGTYSTDVIEAIRPTRLGTWTPQHLQIVLTKGAEEVIDELSYPGNPPSIARRQTFNIRCHVMTDEHDTEAVETVINTFAADIVKVVCTEANWYQFGGLSINAEWLPVEDVQADGGVDGVNVPIAITYRTSENDPYEVRA
jgi:hypothetical protein